MRRLLDCPGISVLIFAKTIVKLFAIDKFELIIDRSSCIFGNRLYISTRFNDNNEFMILVSNQYHQDRFTLYARR